jgi:hypothetical protein
LISVFKSRKPFSGFKLIFLPTSKPKKNTQATSKQLHNKKRVNMRRVTLKLYSISSSYFTVTVNWPGMLISITPPHMHINLEESLRVGILPSSCVGDPGTHGAMVMGMHGMGVNTPSAAAVAAITIGFAMDWHMPKGMMFNIGLLSMMLASGTLVITKLVGKTIRVPGATPKLHLSMAPMQT